MFGLPLWIIALAIVIFFGILAIIMGCLTVKPKKPPVRYLSMNIDGEIFGPSKEVEFATIKFFEAAEFDQTYPQLNLNDLMERCGD